MHLYMKLNLIQIYTKVKSNTNKKFVCATCFYVYFLAVQIHLND